MKRTRRNTPGIGYDGKPMATECARCHAPRWNRTKLCRAHYFQDYRKRRPEYDSNAARKRKRLAKAVPDQTPRCKNRWCKRALAVTAVGGILRADPCERCARFAKGRCYACNEPLTAEDVRGWNRRKTKRLRCRWHSHCYRKRFTAQQVAATKRWLEKHPETKARYMAYRRAYWHEFESPNRQRR